MKECFVVIDMQNDFVFGALGSPMAQAILPSLREELAKARKAGSDVVFTRDTHGSDYLSSAEGKKLPVEHCIEGTDGWKIVEGLYQEGDVVFDKPTFGSVALAEYLTEKDYDKVVFVGVCTDICVISNVLLYKAFSPEKQIAVLKNCVAGATKDSSDAALVAMASCQIDLQ